MPVTLVEELCCLGKQKGAEGEEQLSLLNRQLIDCKRGAGLDFTSSTAKKLKGEAEANSSTEKLKSANTFGKVSCPFSPPPTSAPTPHPPAQTEKLPILQQQFRTVGDSKRNEFAGG